ncbi:MAG: Trm112 family protein [Pseudomonadota bacterium]
MDAVRGGSYTLALENKLLEILACPVSKAALLPLGEASLDKLNAAITSGTLQYVDGSTVLEPLEQALVTEDNHVVYRVADGIPQLLPERGIGLTQLD